MKIHSLSQKQKEYLELRHRYEYESFENHNV